MIRLLLTFARWWAVVRGIDRAHRLNEGAWPL